MSFGLTPNWWLSDGTNAVPAADSIDYGVTNGQYQPYWKSPGTDGTAAVTAGGNTGRKRWIIRASCIGLSLVVMLLLVGALVITLVSPSCHCSPTPDTASPMSSSSLSVIVDFITYQANQIVAIDGGSHVLQCTARNVPSGTTVTWDFSEVDLRASIVQTETRPIDGTEVIEDVTSTVYVESIESRSDLENTLMCTAMEQIVTTKRRKRQTLDLNLEIEIMLNVEVSEPLIAYDLSLSIDSTLQTDGSTITLTGGPHTFECYGSNPRPDASIIWVFGLNPVPPTISRASDGEIRNVISGLEITADYCGIQVTCAVVSCGNAVSVLDSHSITVNLLVNTAPSSSVLTPVLTSSLDATGVFVTVTEGIATEFHCEIFGTTLGSAEVKITLHKADGTEDIYTFPGTTVSDLSCSSESFTRTVSITPTYDDHHGQRLDCVASNDVGSTKASYVILDVQVPPSTTNDGTNSLRLFINGQSYGDGSVAVVTPGEYRFDCITGYSSPVSSVTWTFGGTDNVLIEDAQTTSHDGALTSYRSIIFAEDLGTTDCDNVLVCEAKNAALSVSETPPSISVTLRVNAPPTAAAISVTGTGSSFDDSTQEATLLTSARYTFTCDIDGADEEPDVTWTLTLTSNPNNPSQETDAASSSSVDCLVGRHSETFVLTTDFDEHNGQTLTCAASNKAGSIESTVTLNIVDDWSDNTFTFLVDDVARSDGDIISVIAGADVTFYCTVDNPVPSADVDLDFGGGDTEDSTTTTRAFTSAATVTCTGSNEGGSASISVDITAVSAVDCYDLLDTYSFTTSGEYIIYPDDGGGAGPVAMKVWCDMDTDGGGWTVFQRRQDGTVDFWLNWADYKAGFPMADGMVDPTGEFWLGNDNLYTLSNNMGITSYDLRVDMNDGTEDRCAIYGDFMIADESDKYRLTLGAYDSSPSCTAAGNALGTGIPYGAHGEQFSTKDDDNDSDGAKHCAQQFRGAWWYKDCHTANLNGIYKIPPGSYSDLASTGLDWAGTPAWRGREFSLTKTEMKLRPVIVI